MAGYLLSIAMGERKAEVKIPGRITFAQLSVITDQVFGFDFVEGSSYFVDDETAINAVSTYIDGLMKQDRSFIYRHGEDEVSVTILEYMEDYKDQKAVCVRAEDMDEVNGRLAPWYISETPGASDDMSGIYRQGAPFKKVVFNNDSWSDADMDSWKKLYSYAKEIKELKPWETFGPTDLIAVPADDDFAFISVIGMDGEAKSVSIYDGVEGLNDYCKALSADAIGIDKDYAMFTQNCITCHFGTRADMNDYQADRLKKIGMGGLGTYFLSIIDGYFPFDIDAEEVTWLIPVFKRLAAALKWYQEHDLDVKFKEGMLFFADPDHDKYEARNWPIRGYMLRSLMCPDQVAEDFSSRQRNDLILELDILVTAKPANTGVRPSVPKYLIGADAKTGKVIFTDLVNRDKLTDISVLESMISYFSREGIPKRIKIKNPCIKGMIGDLCEKTGVDLRLVTGLTNLDQARESILGYLRTTF